MNGEPKKHGRPKGSKNKNKRKKTRWGELIAAENAFAVEWQNVPTMEEHKEQEEKNDEGNNNCNHQKDS